jgi:FAD synthase
LRELIFERRLREERKFESVDALKEQIGRDVARAQGFFQRVMNK